MLSGSPSLSSRFVVSFCISFYDDYCVMDVKFDGFKWLLGRQVKKSAHDGCVLFLSFLSFLNENENALWCRSKSGRPAAAAASCDERRRQSKRQRMRWMALAERERENLETMDDDAAAHMYISRRNMCVCVSIHLIIWTTSFVIVWMWAKRATTTTTSPYPPGEDDVDVAQRRPHPNLPGRRFSQLGWLNLPRRTEEEKKKMS
jgi:hypothetical protein